MDLTDPSTQSKIDAAKKAILGKKLAFKNCKFAGQGGDTVAFAPAANLPSSADVDCVMAGGSDGTKKFRRAAMEYDLPKLKLDVSGTVKEHEKRIVLADCSITPHE
jgi:hypothetical protein